MSVVVVIEVGNAQDVIAEHGTETYEFLHRELIERLRAWIRKQDQLVVDKGGRICVLLKGVDDQGQVNLAANKLLRLTAPSYECFGSDIRAPIFAGFAFTLGKGDTRDAALARAGSALMSARLQDTPWEVFRAKTTSSRLDERELVEALKLAIDRGEFMLFFQPKVNAAYRTLVGAEALIRWSPDGKETIGPDQFIPTAEKHGIIKPISHWVLKSAIARCSRWNASAGVAINLSPTTLESDDVVSVVADCLALYDLEGSRVTLEITETAMAENQQAFYERLTQLRELGVRIAIDDFGTGYSSLQYFRDLPADEIKIDKTFVQMMETSAVDAAIVQSVIDLARNLSLQVVAEGVESEACADKLLEMGCHTLQGYFIDKPLPAEDFEMRNQLGLSRTG